jgi:hypothetical protein
MNMKTFITTLTLLIVLVLLAGTSTAQDKKPKPEPPKIEIFIEPLGGNRAQPPVKVPASPNGSAVFPKILGGPFIFGVIILPPQPGQIPIEIAPLHLTAVVQVTDPKGAKPTTTVSVSTKDGQNASAQGEGKAKVEIEKVQPPPAKDENGAKRIDLGQINIGAGSKEGELPPKFKLRIDLDYPKPKPEDK